MSSISKQLTDYAIVREAARSEFGVAYEANTQAGPNPVFLFLLSTEKSQNLDAITRIVSIILRHLDNDWSRFLALVRDISGQVWLVTEELAALQFTTAEFDAEHPTAQQLSEVTQRLMIFQPAGGRQSSSEQVVPVVQPMGLPFPQPHRRSSAPAAISLSIPVPAFITRMLSREEPPDPVEQAFNELDPGWFSVDAPNEMQVGTAAKVNAGAIRHAVNRQLLAATLEQKQAQLEATNLGRLVRVELIPDSEEDFQVRALSVAEQPVLSTEPTRWEWLVTPRLPGERKALRVVATNLVDVNGQRLGKSHPVKTLHVRVKVRGDEAAASISAASLRKICDEAMRVDSDLEAFCVDYFPTVHRRFTRGMERVEKLNLLLSAAPADKILNELKQAYPEAVAAIPIEPPRPALEEPVPPPVSLTENPPALQPDAPPKPVELSRERVPKQQHIDVAIPLSWLIVFVLNTALLLALYFYFRR